MQSYANSVQWSVFFGGLTAFLWVSVVADEDFLAWSPEEGSPIDGVVEAETGVIEDVDVPCADLIQRLELERRDPTLFQDQERNTDTAAESVK